MFTEHGLQQLKAASVGFAPVSPPLIRHQVLDRRTPLHVVVQHSIQMLIDENNRRADRHKVRVIIHTQKKRGRHSGDGSKN